MRYRVSTRRGGVKEVIWDIEETHNVGRYPTLSEISEAASQEFRDIPLNELAVVPFGGGDAVMLILSRYV